MSVSWKTLLRCSMPSVLLAVVLLAPYLGKAYTIDDTLFLKQAQHALVEPLRPAAFVVTWFEHPERMSAIMPSGPTMAWLLAPVVRFGAPEWLAHTVGLAVLLLGLLATVALALRLGLDTKGATLAGLLVAATPAVLGMASTVMPDVASMSFGVLAMERTVAWRARRRPDQLVLAVVAFALAAMARSHLALLLGAATVVLAADEDLFALRVGRVVKGALPLVAGAVALVALVGRLARDPLVPGGDIVSSAIALATYRTLDRNSFAFAFHWVLAVPLALPWAIVRARRLRWRLAWNLLPTAVMLLVFAGEWYWSFLAPFAALAIVVLVDIVEDAWRRRDRVELALAAWLLIPAPVVIYSNFPSKYLVPAAPAVALLLVRLVERERPAWRARLLGATVVLGALLGVAIVRADATLAGLGRRAAAKVIAPRLARGEHVWFAGHWGYQWYAEAAGARPLSTEGPQPAPGDVVVASQIADPRVLLHFKHKHKLAQFTDETPGGRVMRHQDCAGFYSPHEGFLPWMWGTAPADRFDVWQID